MFVHRVIPLRNYSTLRRAARIEVVQYGLGQPDHILCGGVFIPPCYALSTGTFMKVMPNDIEGIFLWYSCDFVCIRLFFIWVEAVALSVLGTFRALSPWRWEWFRNGGNGALSADTVFSVQVSTMMNEFSDTSTFLKGLNLKESVWFTANSPFVLLKKMLEGITDVDVLSGVNLCSIWKHWKTSLFV